MFITLMLWYLLYLRNSIWTIIKNKWDSRYLFSQSALVLFLGKKIFLTSLCPHVDYPVYCRYVPDDILASLFSCLKMLRLRLCFHLHSRLFLKLLYIFILHWDDLWINPKSDIWFFISLLVLMQCCLYACHCFYPKMFKLFVNRMDS